MSSQNSRPSTVLISEGYVPVIDMSRAYGDHTGRIEVADAILQACRSSGFFMVSGHKVPRATIEDVLAASARFFALPQQAKIELDADPNDPLMRGFSWPARPRDDGDTASLLVPPDLSESFVINRYGDRNEVPNLPPGDDKRLLLPNKLPRLPGFADAYNAYYAQMEWLALDIMQLFAIALGLPADWFADKFGSHMTSLSVNYYPPQLTAPKDRQLRKAAHTDWGTLTILYQDERKSGLQVWHEERGWLDVPSVHGTFVVNIGDLMARWTNDTWSSTVHRVVNPPPGEARQARYSVAFFHQPNHDAVIECLPPCANAGTGAKYRPVRSFDFISAKARRAYMEERVLTRRPAGPRGQKAGS